MAVRMEGMEAHLEGDWTISGVEENIHSLMHSLVQIEAGGSNHLSVDCGELIKADKCGLQLLKVWLLCARLRGVEPKLVNITEQMYLAIQQFGLDGLTASGPRGADTQIRESETAQ
ncbi:MAG: STAS domain-containing protein [Desulfuromonadaceae bacterium]